MNKAFFAQNHKNGAASMDPTRQNEAERLRALHDLAILDTPPEDHFDAVVRLAQYTFGVPTVLISLVDKDRQWFKARCGLDANSTPREHAFCNYTIMGDDILVVPDAREDLRFASNPIVVGGPRVRFYAGAPLELRPGIRIGTLCLIDTSPRSFSGDECVQLHNLAQIVAAQLKLHEVNKKHAAESRLRQEREVLLRSKTQDLQRREAELLEANRLLTMAERMAQIGHWRIALPSQQFTWSDEVARIFGLDPGAYPPDVPTAIVTYCHPEDRSTLEQVYAELIASGDEAEHSIRLVRPNGETRFVTFRAVREKNVDGQAAGLFGVIIDHTEFKLTESRAQETAALLSATLENMDQGLMMIDSGGVIQVANSRAEQLLALPKDFLKSRPSFEEVRVYQEQSGDYTAANRAALPFIAKPGFDGTVPTYERERPDGTVLEVRTVPLPEGGAVRTYTDVTARKRAEAIVAESEARYRALSDALPQKVWVTTPDGEEVYRNKQMDEYCGPVGTSLKDRIGLNHPDDAPRMWAEREAGMRSGKGFEVEGRLRRHDGEYRWHRLSLVPILTGGEITGWVGTSLDIHEIRAAQDELRETANRLQLAQEAAGAGNWDLDLTRWEARLCPQSVRSHGLPEGHSGEITAQEWESLIADADVPRVQAAIRWAIETRSTYSVEFRIPLSDGSVRWLHGLGRVLFDEQGSPVRIIGLNLDVTERKAAVEALKASEERFALALDASEDGLWDWNLQADSLWISSHCCAILGYEPHEFEPSLRSWKHRIHPEDEAKVLQALKDHLRGRTPLLEVEHRLRHKNGSWVWTLDRGKVVARGADGAPIRAVGTLIDITHRKRTECALAMAKAAADAARAEAEQASAAKSEFLATMSHEVRTPLHGILGHTDLLLADANLKEEQRRHADRIRGAGSALLTVVNDILDFSKIDAGQVELDVQEFAPTALIDNAVSIVRGMAEAKGLELTVDATDELPDWVEGDQDRLRQILLNLLNNAVKFTPSGSVTLRVQCIHNSGSVCRLRFSVQDTGIGIPQDKHDRLFQRFSQVDGSIRRGFGGTGLGLAISKRLIDLMGGEIGVQSREGHGTTCWFRVDLPVARGGKLAEKIETIEPAPSRAARILLAEDNEINQEIACAVLQAAGHAVDIVADGAQAIMAVQTKAYDLVLMDIQMPNVDGITATQHIRALQHPARDLPIIAMTANVLPQQIEQFQAAGLSDHVGKPFKREELYTVVNKWIGAEQGPAILPQARASAALDPAVLGGLEEVIGADGIKPLLGRLAQQLRSLSLEGSGRDPSETAREAHKLVSSAGMLGFLELSAICRELEDACHTGREITSLLDRLRRERAAALAEMEAILAV